LCVDDRDSVNFGKFVFIHSRKALEQLRAAYGREAAPEVSQLQDALRRLAYEWVMSSLLDAWRQDLEPHKPYWCQQASADYRTLYQEACNHYTHLQLHGGGERGSRTRHINDVNLFWSTLTTQLICEKGQKPKFESCSKSRQDVT
ncbi:hypothetical protein ANCDUO_18197, partial [Ancylostoma duodenale]